MENKEASISNKKRFILQSCIYNNTVDSGFQYLVINKGENFISDTSDNNVIIVIKGKLDVDCGDYKNRIISEQNMIFVQRRSSLTIRVILDAEIMIFRFVQFANSCAGLQKELLKKYCWKVEYDFQPIPVKAVLYRLIDSIKVYIKAQMDCVCFHKLKHKEFFICLASFYTVDELVYLFYPLLIRDNDKFRQFVLGNYEKLSNVKKLVELSGMSKTQFYEKFKVEFGITAKQWLLKHTKEKVCKEAMNPDYTVKEIMFRSGFDNAGQFNKFCHQQFNLSPTGLIHLLRGDTECPDFYTGGKKGNKKGIK